MTSPQRSTVAVVAPALRLALLLTGCAKRPAALASERNCWGEA